MSLPVTAFPFWWCGSPGRRPRNSNERCDSWKPFMTIILRRKKFIMLVWICPCLPSMDYLKVKIVITRFWRLYIISEKTNWKWMNTFTKLKMLIINGLLNTPIIIIPKNQSAFKIHSHRKRPASRCGWVLILRFWEVPNVRMTCDMVLILRLWKPANVLYGHHRQFFKFWTSSRSRMIEVLCVGWWGECFIWWTVVCAGD